MKRFFLLVRDDRGSVASLTVVLMAVFIGLLAVVIDLGHLHTVQNELRNAADSCALRGARAFLEDSIPVSGSLSGPQNPPDPDRAKGQAQLTIGDNRSDNVALTDLPSGEIQVGIWYYKADECPGSDQLQAWAWPPPTSEWGKYIGPGIRLPVKRDASHNQGQVQMTLSQIFGKDSAVDVNNPKLVTAAAALSGVGGFVPGSPTLPFGPMKEQLPTTVPPYDYHGTFNGGENDTIGWSNLNPADITPNAAELKKIMNQGAQYDCPGGSDIGLQNGVDASVIQAMTKQSPLNRFGLQPNPSGSNFYYPSDTLINPATNPPVSYADTVYMMPVYEKADGSNPNFNQGAIVGAVPVQIIKVATSPDNYIDVRIVEGNYVAPGYGGGPYYGILATEPKLVQ